MTQAGGFQVIVLKGDKESAGGAQSGPQTATLIVNRGIPDAEIPAVGQLIELAIPSDAFAHGKPDAIVTLEAKLAGNEPLPAWLEFDPVKGTFKGTPPEGLKGEVIVKVIARDNTGAEVEASFRIRIVDPQGEKLGLKGKLSLTRQLADAGRVMKLGERDTLIAKIRNGTPTTDRTPSRKG